MIDDFANLARFPPKQHQIVGVGVLVQQPYFLLADEMGAGKTKQVIDAAQILFHEDKFDKVIVIAPKAVRDGVWFNPDFGELAKHLWASTHATVTVFHNTNRVWNHNLDSAGEDRVMRWYITNYEFIRREENLEELLSIATQRTILVLDETSAVKSARAQQTIQCRYLRKQCGYVWLLNGTPVAQNPMDLYAQAAIMDPAIFGCENRFHFRSKYGIMGGFGKKRIVGWRHAIREGCCTSGPEASVHSWDGLGDIQKRLKPYVLRRLKSDCLDLPEKLPPVTLTVPLTPRTWAIYCELKEELIAWLDKQTVAVAPQAGVKVMRLAQITSGFLGGLQDPEGAELPPREIGTEKIDLFLEWWKEMLDEDPNLKLLIWCRFRAELARLVAATSDIVTTGAIWGGQTKEDRERSIRLLHPDTAVAGPVVVVGTPSSGSLGINLAASHTVLWMSNGTSLKDKLQADDRVHRPGQTDKVSYFDMVATGPQDQRTIDHTLIKSLRAKEDLATWTCNAWIKALEEE